MKGCVVFNIKNHTYPKNQLPFKLTLLTLEFPLFQLLLLIKGAPCLKSLKVPFGMQCVDGVILLYFQFSIFKAPYYFVLSKDKEGEKQVSGTRLPGV